MAANWGEKWGIGDAEKDNGVILLLAKDDKEVSIQNGKGVEYLLTDFQSKRIIERVIIFMHQVEFFLIMNLQCAEKHLLLEKLH